MYSYTIDRSTCTDLHNNVHNYSIIINQGQRDS